MSAPPRLVRQLSLLAALIAVGGLLYSFCRVFVANGKWLYSVPWLALLVVATVSYIVSLAFSQAWDRRHILARTACPSCGTNFGMETALASRHEYLERCKDAPRHHQSPSRDVAPYWDVRCPKCNRRARFDIHKLKLERTTV